MDKSTLATLKNLLAVMEDDISNRNMYKQCGAIQKWIAYEEGPLNKRQAGNDLARRVSWDGAAILQVATIALEEANFHGEARVVKALIENIK